jgi:hypothetical protein
VQSAAVPSGRARFRPDLRPFLIAALLLALGPPFAGGPDALGGHEGPPFPLFRDVESGPYALSLWIGPEVGLAEVFVMVRPLDGSELPAETRVEVGVMPVTGRLAEARYPAEREELRRSVRYAAEVLFDREEEWRVRVRVDGPLGQGEASGQVRATPKGSIGPIGVLVYGLPFIAMAVIGVRVFIRWREPAEAFEPRELPAG